MAEPWLTIIGIGEDGLAGLSESSRAALATADHVFGGPRHLALAGLGDKGRAWPVPFDVAPVLALRGQRVAVLASGDPFWFGAGGSLSAVIDPAEMRVFPAPSAFSLAAARLGWRLEETACIGLHAEPFDRLLPDLSLGRRIVCTLRDGDAASELAAWLTAEAWGGAQLWVMEALGGPRERVRCTVAADFTLTDVAAPVVMAIDVRNGMGQPQASVLPRVPGLPEDRFAHDGQITKAPVRALTLAALAPRPGEVLWDLGAGSGAVSVEWCRTGGSAQAWESRPDRAANIRTNAAAFGLTHRIVVHEGDWGTGRAAPAPDAVFVGGGLTRALFDDLWPALPSGARLVVNAVTLETQGLVMDLQALYGGSLMKIDLAHARPVGRMRGWDAVRTVMQWSAIR